MESQRLCVVTDAWEPQVNGVVTTLTNLVREARSDGWEVLVIHPGMFFSIAAPGYKEVRLSWPWRIRDMVKDFDPHHLHIATEGPLGIAARFSFRRWSYTTAYHTQWADFLDKMMRIPRSWTWQCMRWFHEHGKVMVPTPSIRDELISKGVKAEVVLFGRGVNLDKLKPRTKHKTNRKPRLLSVSRVSAEKNLEAFCQLDADRYELVLVGDGPQLSSLSARYTRVQYLGMLHGSDLADEYVKADCMVFTSRSDTFGLVMIEAQCLGTPVAAYPVKGPIDVVLPETGCMRENIDDAIQSALKLDRAACMDVARDRFNWKNAWMQFKGNLVSHAE